MTTTTSQAQPRVHFLDHLRGFAFLLMAIDHSLHGYAQHWGRFWFFQDSDRSIVFDVLYMHNNSIIIPLLFFAIGTFVIPGYKQYGLGGYLKNRLIRYGVPFCIGIPVSVAILTYPKYVANVAPSIGFFDYWFNVFFWEKLQGGPLWVCFALFFYSCIALGCYLYLPVLFNAFKNWIKWMIAKPILGFITFCLFSAVILGITDLIWGAPWWIGFWKVFYFQASRFLQQALFFFCGTALGALGYLESDKLWKRISDKWLTWVGLSVIFGTAYIWYSLAYFHDGAYDLGLLRHFYRGGELSNIWPVLAEVAPGRLLRTSLHGVFCLSQILMFTSLIHRFASKPTPFWSSLAANGYGIFLIHEMVVVLMQFWLNDSSLPILFKFLIVASVGLSSAWTLSHFLRKLPGFNYVIGKYPHDR